MPCGAGCDQESRGAVMSLLELPLPTRTEAQFRAERAAERVNFRFHALIDIPGDIEPIAIFASDYAEAMQLAERHARMPFKGHDGQARVLSVDPHWDVAVVNGRPMLRAAFERRAQV